MRARTIGRTIIALRISRSVLPSPISVGDLRPICRQTLNGVIGRVEGPRPDYAPIGRLAPKIAIIVMRKITLRIIGARNRNIWAPADQKLVLPLQHQIVVRERRLHE